MHNIQRAVLFICFYFCLSAVVGQTENPRVEIKTVLREIAKQHSVQFNYLDADLAGILVLRPDPKSSIDQKLKALSKEALLTFTGISPGIISVSRPSTPIIPADSLAIQPQNLNPVIIASFLARGISRQLDGSYRISPKKFGLLPGLIEPDVLQTMQQLPGVISADETVSNINVRGGTHDQNLFLWNGIRMFQTGHFFGLVSAFNPMLPQQISIYKNASPVEYSESVSSVVVLSTQNSGIQNDETSVGVNFLSADFLLRRKLSGKASLLLSGRRSLTDFWQSPTYDSYAKRIFQNTMVSNQNQQNINYQSNEKFSFYDLNSQYHQKINDRQQFFLDGIVISNSLDVEQAVTDSSNLRKSALDQLSFGASLHYEINWSAKSQTQFSGHFSNYSLDASDRSAADFQELKQRNTAISSGISLQNRHALNAVFSLKELYQYSETGIRNNDAVNDPFYERRSKQVLRSHALGAELQSVSLNQKFHSQLGLRVNYFEKFGFAILEPRLKLHYKWTDLLSFELLAERKSQTATQIIDRQQDFLGIEKRRWVLSDNAAIPIIKSNQIALSGNFNKSGFLASAEIFLKEVKGISSTSQSFQNQLEFEQISGNYQVYGIEALLQKEFGHFRSWISYSFNHNDYHFKGFHPTDFANNFEIVHAFAAALTYENKGLKIAVGARWNTGKPFTDVAPGTQTNFTPIAYASPNSNSLDDYFQLNASLAYDWEIGKKSSLTAALSLLNVLDGKNKINRYYRRNPGDGSIETVDNYALGFTPNLSLRYRFF